MLDAEEATARLATIRRDTWRADAATRVAKLDPSIRPFADALLRDPVEVAGDLRRSRQHRVELMRGAEVADLLSTNDLHQLMTALHPQLGPTFATWWVRAQREPYASIWSRQGFRAPNTPRISVWYRTHQLDHMVKAVGPYDRDAVWLAAWAPLLGSRYAAMEVAGLVGPLLAAAIDTGDYTGARVFDTLLQVGNGDHAIGVMGPHVIVGLLRSSRTDGWDFVERLLLAAQRQEGLRQSILEAVDGAHPVAYSRMLDLVLDHNLLRFAATVRAAGGWIGIDTHVEEIPQIKQRLERLRELRLDRDQCATAIKNGDAWETYLALCAVATRDVVVAVNLVDSLKNRPLDARAVAVRFIAATRLPGGGNRLLEFLDDESIDVAALAHQHLSHFNSPDAFERFEQYASRLPDKPRRGSPVGIEAEGALLSRAEAVANMEWALRKRPLSALVPWVPSMDPPTRCRLAQRAGKQPNLTADGRDVLVRLVGDRSSHVRSAAVDAMARLGIDRDQAPAVEALLTRGAGDVRRGVIRLLANQPADAAVQSATRLWNSGNDAQRTAACELLAALPNRPQQAVAKAAELEREATERQRELLAPLRPSDDTTEVGPGLGLYRPDGRTRPRAPRDAGVATFGSEHASRIVAELDDLAHRDRDTPITIHRWNGTVETLLADAQGLPSPNWSTRPSGDEANGSGLILPGIFRAWWDDRSTALLGGDGFDALDAYATLFVDTLTSRTRGDRRYSWWTAELGALVPEPVGVLRHRNVVNHVLLWMLWNELSPAIVIRCLDAYETLLARIPASRIELTPRVADGGNPEITTFDDWRSATSNNPWLHVIHVLLRNRADLFTTADVTRLFVLQRWLDEPVPDATRRRVPLRTLQAATKFGVATDDDIRDELLAPHSRLLGDLTRRRRHQQESEYPRFTALADELRARIVDLERRRGDLPTPASALAGRMSSVGGAAVAMELLGRLGRAALVRRHARYSPGREAVYSHLLRVSYPDPTDTAEALRSAAAAEQVSETRLIELAVFAPQWAHLVGEALGWDGLDDAVWWFHAHTKDEQWGVEQEVRETWAALSAERTPLSSDDLMAGAVDVEWFRRSRARLGASRWSTVDAAAKLASGGTGHRRAQLFAAAMLGAITEEAVLARIAATRHQDSVRALGLLPLPAQHRDDVILVRYLRLREFERGASKFGSQRQASERLAVRIGVENLARTAGYDDPQRFVWAMEAAEVADLADGPVSATEGDVTMTLTVDDDGIVELAVAKAGKRLKSVPTTLRKAAAFTELRDRATALAKQTARVRASLEASMIREERFAIEDLARLDRHPVVAPILDLLVLIDETGRTMRRARGSFRDAAGTPVDPHGALRIAHPVDLLAGGTWIAWQEQLFATADRQPFKQAFRELYTLTDHERSQGPGSYRYEGHQIQPRQAMALFSRRGWLTDPVHGDISRVFHHHGITARVDVLDGSFTPAEVELPTIQGVYFHRRGDYLHQPLDSVPPIVFSETMRDLDLVVSVAHAGGVDPESSASTIEMRAALVRETTRLTKSDNIRLIEPHVVIEGTLGEYSVHLGSGVVHRRPGGAICIIPINSQRRGRIFLPFADDDPKTAEIVAKILLLARDHEIKDPTILSQLRS